MRRTDRALASASTGYGIGRRAAPRQSQRQRWIEDVKDSPNFALTLSRLPRARAHRIAVGPHIGDALRWRVDAPWVRMGSRRRRGQP